MSGVIHCSYESNEDISMNPEPTVIIAVAVIIAFVVIAAALIHTVFERQDRIRREKWDRIEENVKKINDQIDNFGETTDKATKP